MSGAIYGALKSRSTVVNSFVALQANDVIGGFVGYGDTGFTYRSCGGMILACAASPSSGIMPTQLTLSTQNTSGSTTTALTISDAQVVTLANALPGASGGTGVANTGLTINLASGAAGKILTSDSSGNATWASPGYLTGAVLLAPSGAQTITTYPLNVPGSVYSPTILDVNGNVQLGFTSVASAVNYVSIFNSSAGNGLTLTAAGSDSNINVAFGTKGTGIFGWSSAALTNQFNINTGTTYQHLTRLNFPATAATQVITFPDATGTLALTSGASGIVNSGLINQLAYYAAAGTTLSGVSIVNSAVLTTTSGGVPTWVASTGSAAPVLANTPTLVTPVLGAATATSINFGGSTLSTYSSFQAWTPAITFATPGDLSVVYTLQAGKYTIVGNQVTLTFQIAFTPTYTTASGGITVTGLPFTNNSATGNIATGICNLGTITFPALCTMFYTYIAAGGTVINIYGQGSTQGASAFGTTQYTTGGAQVIGGSITYLI